MNVKKLVRKHYFLRHQINCLKRQLENIQDKDMEETKVLQTRLNYKIIELSKLENKEVFFNEDLQGMIESTEELQNTIKCIEGFVNNVKKVK
ncbi:hypothetical protein QB607_003126 [Clostridium botulinum]|nr:hypothetical protein [Clostridium botulinum]EKS4395799.1 hypothetical protein [Clostridium botulinum]